MDYKENKKKKTKKKKQKTKKDLWAAFHHLVCVKPTPNSMNVSFLLFLSIITCYCYVLLLLVVIVMSSCYAVLLLCCLLFVVWFVCGLFCL
jgi:Flp pilus assembly protein TadB